MDRTGCSAAAAGNHLQPEAELGGADVDLGALLGRLASELATGLSAWEYRIKPELEERARRARQEAIQEQMLRMQTEDFLRRRQLEEEERQRALARSRAESMLALAGGDPRRAFEAFGEAFRQSYEQAFGVSLPTRQEPVLKPVTREQPLQVVPRTEPPPGFVRTREPKEGEPRWGVEVIPPRTVTELQPTGETRTVLALPEATDQFEQFLARLPDYEIQLAGGQRLSAKEYLRLLRAAGVSGRDLAEATFRLFDIQTPRERLEHRWRMFQMDLELARFRWQQYTDQERLRIQQLEAEAQNAYRMAQIAIEQGRLDEARRHNQRLEELQEQLNRIRERQAAAEERRARAAELRAEREQGPGRPADPTERMLIDAVANAQARVARLREAQRFFQENPAAREVRVGDRATDFVTRDQLPAMLRQAEAELAARQQALDRYRRRITVYTTVTGHRLTSEDIIRWIRTALANGWTREQIRRRLLEHGIPPERFGF